MKSSHRRALGSLGLALAFAGLTATTVHAQSTLTRDQVKAELAEAIRTGNTLGGENSLTLREQYPQRYPAVAAGIAIPRAQVLREFEDARRTGDLLANGEAGLRLNEITPRAYAPKSVAQGRTREEVLAELREATRTGSILSAGETGLPLNQLYPQRYADAAPMASLPMHAASGANAMSR